MIPVAIPYLELDYVKLLFKSPDGFLPGIIPDGIIPAGILPFAFAIPVLDLQVGALLLLVGGLLGLISGFMERD